MTTPRGGSRLHPVRLATRAATFVPPLRGVADRWLAGRFASLAQDWDVIRADDAWTTAALAEAIEEIRRREPDARLDEVIDVGTGTGQAALALAGVLPDSAILGVDLVEAMVERARAKALAAGLDGRVRFATARGSALPVADRSVDLAASVLVQPFGAELARVLRPGGWAVFVYGGRPESPIRFTDAMLRRALAPHGFVEITTTPAGRADLTLARLG